MLDTGDIGTYSQGADGGACEGGTRELKSQQVFQFITVSRTVKKEVLGELLSDGGRRGSERASSKR